MLFFRWWVRQLAGLVPSRLLQKYVEAGEAAVLEIAGDAFTLHVRRRGALNRVGAGLLQDLKQTMTSVSNLPQLRLLRLAPAQVLRKKISLPFAARRDLKTVLGFEIDRETPFEQAEVYWNYSHAPGAVKGKLDVDLIVVPRPVGDAAADAARVAGFVPSALEVANDDKVSTLLWLETPNPLRYYRLPARAKLPLAAIYALVAAIVLMPFAIQQGHFFLADRTIAALETQALAASALNQAANRRVAALAFMGQTDRGKGSALELLAATTRALPDDSFLTSFSLHDGQVTMAGSSEAAAKLIGVLAASPSFRDPVFDAAVLEGDDGVEKFTISAKLAAAGAP